MYINESKKIERFAQRARRVLSLSHEEAVRLGHSKIFPEHILVALISEEGGVGGRVFRELGLEASRVREMVEIIRPKEEDLVGRERRIELDDLTNEILQQSIGEARKMGDHYIGTEHLLLALANQKQSNAVEVLNRLGVTREQIRRQLSRVLQGPPVLKPTSFTLYSKYLEAAENMQGQIEDLRRQVASIKTGETEPQLTSVEKLSELADNIEETRRELTAPVTLPSIKDMSIRLVPSHSLERLEEYRSDEGFANLIAGIFAGGALGLIVSLATGQIAGFTGSSIALLILLLLLSIFSAVWIHRIRTRIERIREKILWTDEGSE